MGLGGRKFSRFPVAGQGNGGARQSFNRSALLSSSLPMASFTYTDFTRVLPSSNDFSPSSLDSLQKLFAEQKSMETRKFFKEITEKGELNDLLKKHGIIKLSERIAFKQALVNAEIIPGEKGPVSSSSSSSASSGASAASSSAPFAAFKGKWRTFDEFSRLIPHMKEHYSNACQTAIRSFIEKIHRNPQRFLEEAQYEGKLEGLLASYGLSDPIERRFFIMDLIDAQLIPSRVQVRDFYHSTPLAAGLKGFLEKQGLPAGGQQGEEEFAVI